VHPPRLLARIWTRAAYGRKGASVEQRIIKGCLGAAWALAAFGVCAQAAPGRDAQGRLVGTGGRALYIYDADTVPGHSACTGRCATVWPPYPAPAAARAPEGFGVVVRGDGDRQWAWHGHPLYGYAGDAHAGDTHGDGVNGTWHLVR